MFTEPASLAPNFTGRMGGIKFASLVRVYSRHPSNVVAANWMWTIGDLRVVPQSNVTHQKTISNFHLNMCKPFYHRWWNPEAQSHKGDFGDMMFALWKTSCRRKISTGGEWQTIFPIRMENTECWSWKCTNHIIFHIHYLRSRKKMEANANQR